MKFLKYLIVPIVIVSTFSNINAMNPLCINGDQTPCKFKNFKRGTYFGKCHINCNANTNLSRQHPKCATNGCNNDCQSVSNERGVYYSKCNINCGNNNQNNNNINNKNKRSLNQNNNNQQKKFNITQTCKTLRCQKACNVNPKGGFFDYCGISCITKGQLCLTQGCFNGCAKNGNIYYDYCSINCRESNKIQPNNNNNNNQQKMCIVCNIKPVNSQFPGTSYCGNSCRSNNNNIQPNNNNNQSIRPAVFTYLQSNALQRNDVELFYDETIHAPNYIFCNFYPCKITVDDITYANAEAAFQAGKTYTKGVPIALQTATGEQAFKLGKQGTWSYNGENVKRMKAVLYAKFTQNPQLGNFLKNTGNKHLIEDSNSDAFWGIGPKGDGKNMLGELLMQLRGQI